MSRGLPLHIGGMTLRALRRDGWVTALAVLTIGLGTAASMAMVAILHGISGDPLPGRSQQLFYPHLDASPTGFANETGLDPTEGFTWIDARNLLQADEATHQAAMSAGRATVVLDNGKARKRVHASGRFTSAGFFSMFGVPFVSGSGWSRVDDASRRRVVVLGRALSVRLFGSTDVVGHTLALDDTQFTVIGVAADWAPRPLFYASSGNAMFGVEDQFFLPLTTALDLDMRTIGNMACWGPGSKTGDQCTWLQFWVQLAPGEVPRYSDFLARYVEAQRHLGRSVRIPDDAPLLNVRQRLAQVDVISDGLRVKLMLAFVFLAVCILNACGLMLAKFESRGAEVGLRRALGASRKQIFVEHCLEGLAIGAGAALLAAAASSAGLWLVRQADGDLSPFARLDGVTIASTLVLAVLASISAASVPAWNSCRVDPAVRLKDL